MRSTKNTLLSPASVDLGLGDQLRTQLSESEEERKKRLLMQQRSQRMQTGPYGPATTALYAGMGGFSV